MADSVKLAQPLQFRFTPDGFCPDTRLCREDLDALFGVL